MTGVDPLNYSAYSAISIDESIIYRATLSLFDYPGSRDSFSGRPISKKMILKASNQMPKTQLMLAKY